MNSRPHIAEVVTVCVLRLTMLRLTDSKLSQLSICREMITHRCILFNDSFQNVVLHITVAEVFFSKFLTIRGLVYDSYLDNFR